ncbi:HNH endonuclease [Frigoriglobus tundricola]|uniref:HNH endonuclease n=1 Tax=Frigoriglobus tundricola TaxID=2774151 RepID=UPI0036F2CAA5
MSQRKKQIRQRFRDAVFTRDGFTCCACGFASAPERAEAEIDAHHITDRHEMPNGGYVAENGITLCAACHEKAEAFHCGEFVEPGFNPAELYARIGSSEKEARGAAERMCDPGKRVRVGEAEREKSLPTHPATGTKPRSMATPSCRRNSDGEPRSLGRGLTYSSRAFRSFPLPEPWLAREWGRCTPDADHR